MKDYSFSQPSLPTNSLGSLDGFWTFEAVETRLVASVELWRRTPGGVRPSSGSGFATDAPWQLLTKATRAAEGDMALMDIWRVEQDEARLNPAQRIMGLSREEVRQRDEASEWLRFVDERDRRLVVLGLLALASGRSLIPWLSLWKALGRGRPGPDGLRWRYSRALAAVAKALNRGISA